MGLNPNGPLSCDQAIRYSGFGVHIVGPVEDFLDILGLIVILILVNCNPHRTG